MEEQRLIELIEQSMREQEAGMRALGRKPNSATRQQALAQVAFLLNAKQAAKTNK